ncbi:hypothetical protein E2C01_079168 [Portunus trituberculatus]|uniref:Uncharacterized protein n=1 Tax=Portunus trituberculatus TaxID=210409 RepID=A0A5B7IIX1_PORTR|nr:hypothetical protein [Portunus trituberculatus]
MIPPPAEHYENISFSLGQALASPPHFPSCPVHTRGSANLAGEQCKIVASLLRCWRLTEA